MVRKKVGTITLALGLISVGVLLFAQNFIQLPVKDLYKYWPVLLIGLGLEMIIYMVIYGREGSNVKLGIDGLCIFFIIILGLYSSGANFFNLKGPDHIFQGIHIGDFENFDGIRYKGEINENFTKDNVSSSYTVKEVKVSNDYGDIKVVPSDSKTVKVEAHLRVKFNEEQKAREYIKNAIEIKEGETTEISPRALTDAEKKDYSRARIDFTIYVPENAKVAIDEKYGDVNASGIKGGLDVDSKNGEVSVGDIAGNVDIASAFGNIEAKAIKGDAQLSNRNGNIDIESIEGLLTVDSSYGNIDISDVAKDVKVTGRNGEIAVRKVAGKATVENSYGNIDIEDIGGDLVVDDKNGNIEMGRVEGNVNVENAYGDVRYNSDNIRDASINARTSYGDINSDIGIAVKKTSTQAELQGTLGSGKWKIELNTKNGNINID